MKGYKSRKEDRKAEEFIETCSADFFYHSVFHCRSSILPSLFVDVHPLVSILNQAILPKQRLLDLLQDRSRYGRRYCIPYLPELGTVSALELVVQWETLQRSCFPYGIASTSCRMP